MKNCRQKLADHLFKKTLYLLLFFSLVASDSYASSDSSKKQFFHFSNPLTHLKNPFKKNKLKYIDTITTTSSNFRLNEINSKVIKTTTYPVPVGFNDFEDNLRDMQILGKIPSDNSFTNRPYYLNTQLTYDSLLKLIDTSIKYGGYLTKKKNFEIRLTPFNILQKYTSDHPYGYNDGPLTFSKGFQFLVSGGIAMRWKFISLQIRPELYKTAGDYYETGNGWGAVTNSESKIIAGQSSFNINLGPILVTAGTQNLWSGPGVSNSLMLSNNAQGFKFINIKNIKPINLLFSKIEFNLISGLLSKKNHQLNEIFFNESNYPKNYPNTNFYDSKLPYPENRRLTSLIFTLNPVFMKNVYFGFNRTFITYVPLRPGTPINFMNEYLPVFNGIFRTQYLDDNLAVDQRLNFFSKIIFPEDHSQIYFEFLFNDGVANYRDLVLRSQRATAYLFGFNKYFKISKSKFISLNFEANRIAELPNYLISFAGTIYEHSKIYEGYTNNEQLLGPGSGNGNNSQQISLLYNNSFFQFGLKFEHISQGPINYVDNYFTLNLRKILWDDYLYGIQLQYKLKKNILLKSSFNVIKSRNFLWKKNNNKINYFPILNLIYLW